MTKQKISFSIDRTSAHEGEVVTVSWDCGVPDSVTLRIENGYRTSILQLPDSGTRAILEEKSKGKTTLRLSAACGTRVERRELTLRVKNLKTIKAEPIHNRRKPHLDLSNLSLRQLWLRAKGAVVGFWRRVEYGWRVMPPKTKRIYKIMLIVLAVMWISALGQSRGYKAGYEQGIKDRTQVEQTYKQTLPPSHQWPQGEDKPQNSAEWGGSELPSQSV